MRDAKINFELAADQCTPNDIQAWMDVLEDAANWSDANDCSLFFDQAVSVVGASFHHAWKPRTAALDLILQAPTRPSFRLN